MVKIWAASGKIELCRADPLSSLVARDSSTFCIYHQQASNPTNECWTIYRILKKKQLMYKPFGKWGRRLERRKPSLSSRYPPTSRGWTLHEGQSPPSSSAAAERRERAWGLYVASQTINTETGMSAPAGRLEIRESVRDIAKV